MRYRISGSNLCFLICLTILIVSGCAWRNSVDASENLDKNPQELAIIASEAAMKIKGHYLKNNLPLPTKISGADGLRIASQYTNNQDYLRPVYGIYILFLANQRGDVIVLGCDDMNGKKIFEDSTADSKIDIMAWESPAPEPCASTLLQQ